MNKRIIGSALALVGAVSVVVTAEPESIGAAEVVAADAFGHTKIRAGVPVKAKQFPVISPDVRDGKIPSSAWANTFGCTGGNQQLRLEWHGAPAGTKSFAASMQDADASTGSGFWHWMTWDIPGSQTKLDHTPPAGAVSGTNDAGATGYLGPCPPAGDIPHRYVVTVYALDTASLKLPAASSPAVAAFTMSGHVLGYGRVNGFVQRTTPSE
ncbi:YbhB/YbcL family Raf kinase inhibitor-like protein [Allokutzneria sp. NRRL B-24872]|uniref:YbhB/YbcL family Raf kinase inhibitor-like protein n=1 Tax=Allokutzneria sp. NRRL B-24872 TaxID=1137961 RepID=UPI001AEF50B9|nr:YbhB/YbcL family Raf kinase inhibitor-like protein [Allokutzneria sp. NRRL B-24872]